MISSERQVCAEQQSRWRKTEQAIPYFIVRVDLVDKLDSVRIREGLGGLSKRYAMFLQVGRGLFQVPMQTP